MDGITWWQLVGIALLAGIVGYWHYREANIK
jgi:hypothetical protein